MAGLARRDVPQVLLPSALPEHPAVLDPALLAEPGRLFVGLQAAHFPDVRMLPDGLPAALFAAEARRDAVAAPAVRLVPRAELLRAVLASVWQEQHSAQPLRDEQHWPGAHSQGGAAASRAALPPVPKVSLPQAEPLRELRAAPDALQAALQRPASQLA